VQESAKYFGFVTCVRIILHRRLKSAPGFETEIPKVEAMMIHPAVHAVVHHFGPHPVVYPVVQKILYDYKTSLTNDEYVSISILPKYNFFYSNVTVPGER